MKTKILFFTLLILVSAFVVTKINEYLLKNEIKNIKYDYQLITDFKLIGKSKSDYFLKGKSLLEKEGKVYIEKFDLTYFKEDKPIYVTSKKGIYFRKNKLLKLQGDVKIKDKNMKMLTEELNVFTDKNTAETDKDVLILTKKSKTTGKKAFIDVDREIIKVYKAKTIIE
jgi:LPS export ABC transporter protein LptC